MQQGIKKTLIDAVEFIKDSNKHLTLLDIAKYIENNFQIINKLLNASAHTKLYPDLNTEAINECELFSKNPTQYILNYNEQSTFFKSSNFIELLPLVEIVNCTLGMQEVDINEFIII